HVFWDDDQRILRMRAGGGAEPEQLANHAQPAVSLAIDPRRAPIRSTASGCRHRSPPSACSTSSPTGRTSTATTRAPGLAPFNVYRLKPNGHGLVNLAKGGGGLAVDARFVYYHNANRTAIMKWCKI